MASADPAGDLLPHEVRSWKYVSGGKLQSDPQLTVTGNIDIMYVNYHKAMVLNNKFRGNLIKSVCLLIFR